MVYWKRVPSLETSSKKLSSAARRSTVQFYVRRRKKRDVSGPGLNWYHVFLVEFANDLITVDEMCIGGGGLVHMSKFTTFMALKVVVCIGSNMRFLCIEVISSKLAYPLIQRKMVKIENTNLCGTEL
jgi:hypothetical protein